MHIDVCPYHSNTIALFAVAWELSIQQRCLQLVIRPAAGRRCLRGAGTCEWLWPTY
jgi:hypothetical protein